VDHDQEPGTGLDEMSGDELESKHGEPEAVADATPDLGDDSDAPIRLDDAAPGDEAGNLAAVPMEKNIRAENVTVSGSGAASIEATTVSINQGGAARVRADEVSLQQSGLFMARAGKLTVNSDGSAFAVVADEATVEEGANVFLLAAGTVKGDVRPIIDWRAGLAFAGGLALGVAILRRLR
jgi:hypothetical protein